MARAKWCGSEIYDVAAAFKERCLVGNDSLVAPGSSAWTPEHVLAVGECVGVEDLGAGSFIEKLEAQLDGLAPAEIQVGAELLYMLLLPEADTGGPKKREHITRILGMLPDPISLPPEVDAALDAGGVANFAAAKAYRDAGLRFLARLFARLKAMSDAERQKTLDSPWEFRGSRRVQGLAWARLLRAQGRACDPDLRADAGEGARPGDGRGDRRDGHVVQGRVRL